MTLKGTVKRNETTHANADPRSKRPPVTRVLYFSERFIAMYLSMFISVKWKNEATAIAFLQRSPTLLKAHSTSLILLPVAVLPVVRRKRAVQSLLSHSRLSLNKRVQRCSWFSGVVWFLRRKICRVIRKYSGCFFLRSCHFAQCCNRICSWVSRVFLQWPTDA